MNKLFENFRNFVIEKEEKETSKTLMQDLEQLLLDWPACDPEKGDPNGMACQYHKDLEEVVKEYGRSGCPPGTHEEEPIEER